MRTVEMGAYLKLLAHVGDRFGQPAFKLLQLAGEVGDCGSALVFRNYLNADVIRLHAARFCKRDKLCPFCAIRRGAKLLRRYAERVEQVLSNRVAPGSCMVTFTVKNGPDLVERFEHLRRSMQRLMDLRKYQLAGRGGRTEAARAWAGASSVEIKRGSGSGTWHPHSHSVWLCDELPKQEVLREEWLEITGDSHQVQVTPLHFIAQGLAPTVDHIAPDFAEVFKYAVKFSTMTLDDAWEAHSLLKARRLVFSFGDLYGIAEPDDLTDDPIDDQDLPFVDMVYAYVGNGVYELQDLEHGRRGSPMKP